jgi:exopolysaccharide biosynthesis polyprenyl glycosylphosphotransferase
MIAMTDLEISSEHGTLAPTRRRRFRALGFTPASRRRDTLITEGNSAADVRVRDGLFRRALAVSDAFAAALSLVVVIGVQAQGEDIVFWALAAMPLIVLVHKVAGLYERDEVVLNRTTLDEVPTLVQLSGLFALIVWLGHWQLFSITLTPEFVLELWFVSAALLISGRIGARAFATRRAEAERCLLIGDPATINTLAGKLRAGRFKATVAASVPLHGVQALDGRDFTKLVEAHDVHRVVFAPTSADVTDLLELVRLAKAVGVRVSLVPRLFEVIGSSVEFDHLDGLTMLGVRRFGLTRSSRLLKRGFDLAGATVGLFAIAPVMAAIAVAIRLDTRGPVFFRQTRVGRDGRHFGMLKFRSMDCDAESRKEQLQHLNETSGLFKIADDPRITRVGRFLRRTSLDELPQLLNVWRGEMSLVGPRPLVVDEDAKIEGLDRSRLHLTPGMTGHWQILGSARIPLEEMVGIDYLYVANWSLWNDMKLLLRTVPFVLGRRGL